MTRYSDIAFWKELPDRDEVLDRVFAFLRALSQKDPVLAAGQVLVADFAAFRRGLNAALHTHLSMVLEDEDMERYEEKDLSLEVDDPAKQNEDLMTPEFSGTGFRLDKGETMSLAIFLAGEITPVRLHFSLIELDELFYLKLNRITDR